MSSDRPSDEQGPFTPSPADTVEGEDEFFIALGEQAEREMRSIEEDAAGEEVRIISEASEKTRRHREGRLRSAGDEAAALKARTLHGARFEKRKRRLLVERTLVTELTGMMEERLRHLPERNDYRLILEALFDECDIDEGDTIRCRRDDVDIIESIASRRGLILRFEETAVHLGGYVVHSRDGLFIQRNTFGDRLRKIRLLLEKELGAALG